MPKRVESLAELTIRSTKQAEKDIFLFDGRGLFMKITPSGGKLWRFKYRFDG